MSEQPTLFHIHRDYKYGGFDFGVDFAICKFSVEEMNQFRAMLVCAIGTAEDMFRREIERRNPTVSAGSGEPPSERA